MLSILDAIARANGGLVTRRQANQAGVSDSWLARAARRGHIARVARGVYAVPTTAVSPAPARETAVAMRVVLSFESAAAWWRVDLPAAVTRLLVTAPRSRGRRRDEVPGVRIHRANLRPDEITVVAGVRVTTPLRTALDISRHASLEHAVAIVDAFMRKGLLRYDEFVAAAAAARGPGRRRLMAVSCLVDPASGSILESLGRVLLWRHRLLPPRSQYPLRHPVLGWVGYLDFAWPDVLIAVELDGYEWHGGAGPFQKDRRRWTALARAGWRVAVFTWFDVVNDPAYVVACVADLVGGAVQVPAHNRVA